MRGSFWSLKELKILNKFYPLVDRTILQKDLLVMLPRRSWSSIQNEAYKNNLFKLNPFWSISELEILREAYPKLNKTVSKKELCKKLSNRSWNVILEKIKELKLDTQIKSKKCSHCQMEKPISNFRINTKSHDNFTNWCISCTKKDIEQYYKDNPTSRHLAYRKHYESLKGRYSYLKACAKVRKLNMLITLEQYAKLLSNPCYYCENILDSTGVGLDRINNDKSIGYVIGNVLPCCRQCNKTRCDIWTVKETKIVIQAVLQYRKNKGRTNDLSTRSK